MAVPADSLKLTDQITPEDLHPWMAHRRFPSAFELTSANFQDVMHSELPSLAILVAVDESEAPSVEELLSEISITWKAQSHSTHAFFVWMNAEKWRSWLSHMYGFRPGKSPFVVIADHKVRLRAICLIVFPPTLYAVLATGLLRCGQIESSIGLGCRRTFTYSSGCVPRKIVD